MKVEFHKDENGKLIEHYDHNNKAPGLLRVFIDDKRTGGEQRPGMQNIMADFAWRRSVKMADIKKDPTFRKTISEFLKRSPDELAFRFNRYCGCAMCPCSPGILIQDKLVHYQPAMVREVWVTISDDSHQAPLPLEQVQEVGSPQ